MEDSGPRRWHPRLGELELLSLVEESDWEFPKLGVQVAYWGPYYEGILLVGV